MFSSTVQYPEQIIIPIFASELEKTLHKSLQLAIDRYHEYATLEHLLAALTFDTDALEVFTACDANVEDLRNSTITYLDNELTSIKLELKESGEQSDPSPTAGFQRVIQRAILHAQSSGHDEVNGAGVLIALFSERDSQAVHFLLQQDMSRLDVVSYVSHRKWKNPRDLRAKVVTAEPLAQFPSRAKSEKLDQGLEPTTRFLGKFLSNLTVLLDMKPHVDTVSLQPTLNTPIIAEKIVEFVYELTILASASTSSNSANALTVGVYGPWGSGKSTLLSKVAELFSADKAIVAYINAWKWDGEKNIYDFMTDQLLKSLSESPNFRRKARLIKSVLYVRRRCKRFAILGCTLLAVIILGAWLELSGVSVSDLSIPESLLAILGAGTLGALAKPTASLAEKLFLKPRRPPEPGVKLSQAFKYLDAAKRIGETAGKPIIFVFDDLDRCSPDRVMKFVASIQNLTYSGAINIIGCDDRIITAAIYKQFQDIAELSGEGTTFGTKFLEKIVQVHFRMPELSGIDLGPLGIKPDAADTSELPEHSAKETTKTHTYATALKNQVSTPQYNVNVAVDKHDSTSPDEVALSLICGEVLGTILESYHLPIRKIKYLSNIMKLYAMVFPPSDVKAAFRLAAFIGMVNVDKLWLERFYRRLSDESLNLEYPQTIIHEYLGSDKELLSSLYLLCGIGIPRD